MPELKLRDEIINKGLTINVVASYILKKAEPSTVQDTNQALLLALEQTKQEWKNSSIYEANAINLLSNINISKQHFSPGEKTPLGNIKKVYECLELRHYNNVFDYSYGQTLKLFILEVLNLIKFYILSVDSIPTVGQSLKELPQDKTSLELGVEMSQLRKVSNRSRAYDLLQTWAKEEKSFWPLFERTNSN